MTAAEIQECIETQFGASVILESNLTLPQGYLVIQQESLVSICSFLRDDERLYFDFLECLSGVDCGAEINRMEVVYHVYSILKNHSIVLKCRTSRQEPKVPSVSSIWRTADWHEREAYDLFGIRFEGHPQLQRIFMPEDWVGHPLRKDYKEAESYHGVSITQESE